MNPLKQLEHELSGFLLFGGIMTPELRKTAAELLFQFLFEPTFDARAALQASQIPALYPHWAQLLDKLFQQHNLQKLTRHNEDFALSVTREALEWCKSTFKLFERQSPLFDEEQQLQLLRAQPRSLKAEKWIELAEELKIRYPRQSRTWGFYAIQLQKMQSAGTSSSPPSREDDILIQNLLDDWEKQLKTKRKQVEAAFIEQSFEQYYQQLSQKVEKLDSLGKQLFPYYSFLGMSWNAGIENWNKIDWHQLEEYAYTLQQDKELRQLAELLGRFHLNATYIREQALLKEQQQPEWKPNPYGKSEIIGITYSDQLSAILPSEVALLSQPETELIFHKKLVEKKLLTFQYRSFDLSARRQEEELVEQQSETADKGPIIMCVDTSGSMFGQPERVAKALAFAILELALREKRKAFLISFSTAIQCIEMTGMEEDLSRLLDFLKMSFHGGTDLQPALKKAATLIQQEAWQHADVLVISDFIISRMNRKLIDLIHRCRDELGTQFHSLHITRRPDPQSTPLTIFDHHWVYDLNNPRVIRQTLIQLEEL